MIVLTVGKTGADFTSLAAALAALYGTTLSDETSITFIDDETYDESNIVSGITTSPTNRLIIQGAFNRQGRTTIRDDATGWLMTVYCHNLVIDGIAFDRQDALDDSRSGIWIVQGWTNIEIAHNHFLGNGYFWQDAIAIDKFVTPVNIYDNLFRRWGETGIYTNTRAAANEVHNIFNNTFVKCQECVWIADYETGFYEMSNSISIWNNIMDMDEDWLIECTEFNSIIVPAGKTPADLKRLDYNLYHVRKDTNTSIFTDTVSLYLDDLAALKFAYPTKEIEGIDDDPDFVVYCSDYHLLPDSPAIASADGIIPVDDNDGETRTSPGNRGCYEESLEMNLKANPQLDRLQNATYWIELEDTRSSGAPRNIRIGLDYQRVL